MSSLQNAAVRSDGEITMCMTVGASVTGSGAFVACDTRSASSGDGLRYDTGGRIVFTGSGWGAGGGAHHALGIALAALRAGAPAVPGVGDYLRAAGYRPGVDVSVRNASSVCVISVDNNDSNRVTVTNGKLWMVSGDDLFYSAPGESDAEEGIARLRQMWADVRVAGVPLARKIRAVAKHFAEVSTLFESVSPVIEVGYILPSSERPRFGFLRGPAAAIANAGPDEILDRFQADCSNLILDEAFEAARAIGQIGQSYGLAAFLDDGKYGLRATESDGSTKVSDVLNGQGSLVPAAVDKNLFTYNSGGATSGQMWLSWSWPAFTIPLPDGSSISVPASSALAAPPTPTLSQVAGGALGARTRFVRIGYVKNQMIMRVGAEGSIAIAGGGNLLKVTSPASVAGYDGWCPLVGATTNTEFTQSSAATVAFGTDWTEPTTGADISGQTPYDNTRWPNAVTAWGLNAISTLFYYLWWEVANAFVAFADRGQLVPLATTARLQLLDGRIPLILSGITGITPAAGTTTNGTPVGGRYV